MARKTGTLPMGDGRCHYIRDGAIMLKKYEGHFLDDGLEDKARTGKWYCAIMGHPYSCEGEGDTPELAVQDAMNRNDELRINLQQCNVVLASYNE